MKKDDTEVQDLDTADADDYDYTEDDWDMIEQEHNGKGNSGDKRNSAEKAGGKPNGSGKGILMGIIVIALLCAVVSGGLLIKNYMDDKKQQAQMEVLREGAEENNAAASGTVQQDAQSSAGQTQEITQAETTQPETTQQPETQAEAARVPNPYAESYAQNKDMAAWIKIPDTVIDYPVMQTMEDENYYLFRGFDRKDNKNGCLILDTDSVMEPIGTNLIIHGHNMKSGAMFRQLFDYENKAFYDEHKYIKLYTEECERNYEVIAVFYTQVYKKTDEVFKFYKFFQADTEAEFKDYYDNIKALSLYDTGVTAQFGDRFLTLSTCSYQVENGRFVVVAKEIEPGEYYLPME